MNPSHQTLLALGLAGLALAYLLWTWLRPRQSGGCGGCAAKGVPTDRPGSRGGPGA